MTRSELIESIKVNEGFEGYEYMDSLQNPTIGYGTLLPLTEVEATLLLKHRLDVMSAHIKSRWNAFGRMSPDVQTMVLEMCYQMGVGGFMGFKKMIRALEKGDHDEAYKEGMDSKWAIQTPNRAKRVLSVLKVL
jgi:lysozyme